METAPRTTPRPEDAEPLPAGSGLDALWEVFDTFGHTPLDLEAWLDRLERRR